MVMGNILVSPEPEGPTFDCIVIAAGEGASAALDINKRLLEESEGRDAVCSRAGRLENRER